MALLVKQIQVSKELSEVMALLVHVAQHLRQGGSLLSLPAAVASDLMAAISGIDQVDDEVKENQEVALRTVGLYIGDLSAALLAPKLVVAPTVEVPAIDAPAQL